MFLEPSYDSQRSGWIEVICGSMFSGKTEELIRRIKRAEIANQSIKVFKPAIDTRYDAEDVVSHDDNVISSTPVSKPKFILDLVENISVVGLDEAQFFDDSIINVVLKIVEDGKRVIIAGLDMDFTGKPFGPMPHFLAIAEYITKVHAICQHCGNLATHSYRKEQGGGQVVLGEKDLYEARCRYCYSMGNILNLKVSHDSSKNIKSTAKIN